MFYFFLNSNSYTSSEKCNSVIKSDSTPHLYHHPSHTHIAMSSPSTPSSIQGGCLCRSVRYTITFPPNHDFSKAVRLNPLPPFPLPSLTHTFTQCTTCQCAQCRAQTGSLVFRVHGVPHTAVDFTSSSTLTTYRASEPCARGFCSNCGSVLFWRDERGDSISMTVGCFDQDALEKYGRLLTEAGVHLYCEREIEGVTDHLRGEKWRFDNQGDEAELIKSEP